MNQQLRAAIRLISAQADLLLCQADPHHDDIQRALAEIYKALEIARQQARK